MHLRASVLAVSSVVLFACAPPLEDEPLTENESERAADASGPVWHPIGKADGGDGGAVEDIGSDLVAPMVWFDGGIPVSSDAAIVADSGLVSPCFDGTAAAAISVVPKGNPARHAACTAAEVKSLAAECAKGLAECRVATAAVGACGTCVLTDLDAAPPGSTTGPLYVRGGAIHTNQNACEYLVSGRDDKGAANYQSCYVAACGSCDPANILDCSAYGMAACSAHSPAPPTVRPTTKATCTTIRGAIDAFCGSGNGTDAMDPPVVVVGDAGTSTSIVMPRNIGDITPVRFSFSCDTQSILPHYNSAGYDCAPSSSEGACRHWKERGTCKAAFKRRSSYEIDVEFDYPSCVEEHDVYSSCTEPLVRNYAASVSDPQCYTPAYGTNCNGKPVVGFSGQTFGEMMSIEDLGSEYYNLIFFAAEADGPLGPTCGKSSMDTKFGVHRSVRGLSLVGPALPSISFRFDRVHNGFTVDGAMGACDTKFTPR